MKSKSLLIIFVKNPELGKVKTRLAATIGKDKALSVYHRLLARTHKVASEVTLDKVVYYDNFVEPNDLWTAGGFYKKLQSGSDLGQRMLTAFTEAFVKGYERVCVIGSDCYDLDSEILNQAFDSLKINQAVIGGAKDGGYYLLGMCKLVPELFQNKEWSTDNVYSTTIADFELLDISYATLPVLSDVDNEDDLGDWATDLI